MGKRKVTDVPHAQTGFEPAFLSLLAPLGIIVIEGIGAADKIVSWINLRSVVPPGNPSYLYGGILGYPESVRGTSGIEGERV